MTTTPNNQDDEIDSILVKLYTSGMHEKQKEFDVLQNMTRKEKKDFRAYIHKPYLAMTEEAKAAILAWHNQQLEQAVVEERAKVRAIFDKSEWNPAGTAFDEHWATRTPEELQWAREDNLFHARTAMKAQSAIDDYIESVQLSKLKEEK